MLMSAKRKHNIHRRHGDACLNICHVTQNGEGDDAGEEAGGGVDEARDDGVRDAVVVELVVGAERGQGAGPDAVVQKVQQKSGL